MGMITMQAGRDGSKFLTASFLSVYLVVQMRRMRFNSGRSRGEKSKRLPFPVHCRIAETVATVQPRNNLQSTTVLLKK